MIYNQMFVVPTPETLEYLSQALSGSSVDLNLQALYVEIMTTLDPMVANPDNVYEAHVSSVKVWYDAYLQRSSLIVSLTSKDLVMRVTQLHEEQVVREFFDAYVPYMTLRPDMPALSNHYRTFVRQAADTLHNGGPLYFGNEFVTQSDLLAPLDADYKRAMIAEIQKRNHG